MSFRDFLMQRNPELYPPLVGETRIAGPAPQPTGAPPALNQIAETVENIMPTIEKITGLSRRDIFMALLKTGLKGGGIDSILNALMGKQEKEVKFVRYVKTLAIWVPVAIFLLGIAIASVVLFVKLLLMVFP